MNRTHRSTGRVLLTAGMGLLVGGIILCVGAARESKAGPLGRLFGHHSSCSGASENYHEGAEGAGTWYWMRSPEEEKRVSASHFTRYCIRCHGVDGRGVWDIPGVPDFTNGRWQISRSDDQIARIIIEGRGALMPPFRGTVSLEEAWALARYLRTFVPGSEMSKPDLGSTEKLGTPTPQKSGQLPK